MKNIRRNVVLLLIMLVVGLAGANIFVLKTKDFWSTTASTCLTMITALAVSYFFVQRNQDERNQKEAYIKIIEKLQGIVEDDRLVVISSENENNFIKMKKRSINNYVGILKQYAKHFNVEKEVQQVAELATEYIDFWGAHCDDIDYLLKSQIDLKRPLELIDGKLHEIMIKIYD